MKTVIVVVLLIVAIRFALLLWGRKKRQYKFDGKGKGIRTAFNTALRSDDPTLIAEVLNEWEKVYGRDGEYHVLANHYDAVQIQRHGN